MVGQNYATTSYRSIAPIPYSSRRVLLRAAWPTLFVVVTFFFPASFFPVYELYKYSIALVRNPRSKGYSQLCNCRQLCLCALVNGGQHRFFLFLGTSAGGW